MKSRLILATGIALLMTSCSSYITYKSSSTLSCEATLTQYPTVADLKVDPVKATKSTTWVGGKMTDKQRQDNLTFELLRECNADVLVEPDYSITKHGNSGTITVVGYPATYVNFRKATEEDMKALRAGYPWIYDVANPEFHKVHEKCIGDKKNKKSNDGKKAKKKKRFLFF